jgi:hypothetical protein
MRVVPELSLALAGITRERPVADVGAVLPSGGVARLQELRTDATDGGVILRFRYVSEGFDPQAIAAQTVADDLHHLCVAHALPALREAGLEAGQVIISLADKPGEFGVADPEIRQVFEAFTINGDRCIWELF